MGKVLENTWSQGMQQQVRDVRQSQVLEWLGIQRQRVSKAYYNDFVLFIRRMFALAVADRLIMESPAAEVKTLKRDTPIRETRHGNNSSPLSKAFASSLIRRMRSIRRISRNF